MQVEDGELEDKANTSDTMMSGESSQGEDGSQWEEEGAVGSDSLCDSGGGSDGGGGSGGDEPPQLSTSPSVRAVQPRGSVQLPLATQLFVIHPVNNRTQNLAAPAGEALKDKGKAVVIFWM